MLTPAPPPLVAVSLRGRDVSRADKKSARLGHANIVLTLDTYTHVLPSMQQAASEKLEGILFKKTGTE
jgi:integrase